jgi:hypothetical protein
LFNVGDIVVEFRVAFVAFVSMPVVATTTMVDCSEDEGGGSKAVAVLYSLVLLYWSIVLCWFGVKDEGTGIAVGGSAVDGIEVGGIMEAGIVGVDDCPSRFILRGPDQLQFRASFASLYFGSGSPRSLVRRRRK